MFLFAVSSFFTAAAGIILGLFVLSKNWRQKTNVLWFLTTAAISMWAFSLGMQVVSSNYETAFLWNKILNIGAIFIPIFFYHFVVAVLGVEKKEKWFIVSGYFFATAVLLFLFNLFTPLFVKGVPPRVGFSFWIEIGPLYYLFFAFFVTYMLRAGYILIKHRKISTGVKRAQINYLLLALLFGFGGGVTNFFPQVFEINIYPFGNYLVVLYVIFITYSILKHHLFNVKVIITELLTLTVWLFLLVRTIISDSSQEFVINGSLLVLIIFFGALLVRSVWKEVEQREKMEILNKKVQKAYILEKKARSEIEKITEAKTQFIMATQHHLRTPLTSMIGYLDLIFGGTYGKVSTKLKNPLEKFQVSTRRLIRVVNTLLDISQFQMGREVVSLKPGIVFEDLVKEVMEELDFESRNKGLYLKYNKIGEVPAIKADPEKLKVALFNIIDNAIKYTREGGVTITLQKIGNKAQFKVQDTGIGLDPEKAKVLFDSAFVRGKEAKKVHGFGRGIGVYITGHIIKAHKGKIWAESQGPGKGTTFFIEL